MGRDPSRNPSERQETRRHVIQASGIPQSLALTKTPLRYPAVAPRHGDPAVIIAQDKTGMAPCGSLCRSISGIGLKVCCQPRVSRLTLPEGNIYPRLAADFQSDAIDASP
ncbi:hypothetical protein STEG23_012237 [Scotinomys teguina]